MVDVYLGIDLGTTTTLIARAIVGENSASVKVLPIRQNDGRGQQELHYLPSVAYFPPDKEPLVGLEAQILGPEEDPSRFIRAVKRQMGRKITLPVVDKRPDEISALYLEKALVEGKYHIPDGNLVFTVTVPASFTSNQRADTLRALRQACEKTKTSYPEKDEGHLFISEPVAAMLAFLNQEFERPPAVRRLDFSKEKNRIVVYDIGGGTLDLTLVFIEPVTPGQAVESLADLKIYVDTIGYYNPFGGEDFDLELAKYLYGKLLDQYTELEDIVLTPDQRIGVRLKLMNIAKDLKEKLSEQMDQLDLFDDEEQTQRFSGDLRIEGQEYHLEGYLSVDEFRQILQKLLINDSRKSLLTPLKDLLKKTSFEPDRLDGLLLVGGMGRMPLVREILEQEFWGTKNLWVFNPPDHAVVAGAAIYSYMRRLYPDFSLEEPAADAYYVRLVDRFDLILPAKAKQGEKNCYKLDSNSNLLMLQIFAGEEPEPGQTEENIYPTLIYQGGTTIPLGKKYPKETPVYVQMRYEDGDEDHTKVPWVYVWLENPDGDPKFRRRYSELYEEAQP